jgi:proteasome lid subunit RPN8/RPN11
MKRKIRLRSVSFHLLGIGLFRLQVRKEKVIGVEEIRKERELKRDQVPDYLCNSRFLTECYEYLVERPEERINIVTGNEVNGTRVLETLVPVELSYSSVAGAKVDDDSILERLLDIESFGLKYFAYFHSHPGHGQGATVPSSIDRSLQEKYEVAGQDVIGAIFSRDGFVRFFSNNNQFRIQVAGKKVKKVGENVFKLETE